MLEAKDILAAALKLDTGERAHLINELPASLEGIDLGTEWEREIQHRIDDIDTGRVAPVSGDERSPGLGRADVRKPSSRAAVTSIIKLTIRFQDLGLMGHLLQESRPEMHCLGRVRSAR